MAVADLARLIDVIDRGIAARGVYWLMDDRLDLICGPKALRHLDNASVTQIIAKFSSDHGWSVARSQNGFLFLPKRGEVDFSEF